MNCDAIGCDNRPRNLTRARWARAVAVVGAITLLAACGGDDGAGLGESSTPDATTAGSSNTTATGSGSGSGTGTPTAECLNAAKAMATAASAVPLAVTGGAGNMQQSIDQLNAFASAAPAEIRNDMKTVAEGYAKVAKVISDAKITPGQTPSPAALAALTKAGAELDNASFKAANDRVSAWFAKECDS
jgi:hypothetical protein